MLAVLGLPSAGEVPPAAVLLAVSDERDRWLLRVLRAEQRGFDRGREAGYLEGRQAEAAERDAAWAEIAAPAARGPVTGRRGEPRTRLTFSRAHPADRPVRPWHPSAVWLGGPPVHHHGCTAPCRKIRPGEYSAADAAAILAGLPGDYSPEIAGLLERAGREQAAS
jgi:hypothetical protein